MIFFNITLADDTSVGTDAQNAWPIINDQIEMESEIVQVYLDWGKATIECEFVLHNTSRDVDVTIGFPELRMNKVGAWIDESEINDFLVWVEGESVEVKSKKAIDNPKIANLNRYKQWFVWTVFIPRGDRIRIKHKYWINLSGDSFGRFGFRYVLTTGATWKGTIKKAEIFIHIGEEYQEMIFEKLQPAGYEIKNRTISWCLEDFEPTQDIEVEGWYEWVVPIVMGLREAFKHNDSLYDLRTLSEFTKQKVLNNGEKYAKKRYLENNIGYGLKPLYYFYLGELHKRVGEIKKAVSYYNTSLTQYPHNDINDLSAIRLAEYYNSIGENTRATAILYSIVDKIQHKYKTYLYLAVMCLLNEKYSEAHRIIEAMRIRSGINKGHYTHGTAMYIEELLDVLSKERPSEIDIALTYIRLTKAFHDIHPYEKKLLSDFENLVAVLRRKTLPIYEKILSSYTLKSYNRREFRYQLAMCYESCEEWTKALEVYSRIKLSLSKKAYHPGWEEKYFVKNVDNWINYCKEKLSGENE